MIFWRKDAEFFNQNICNNLFPVFDSPEVDRQCFRQDKHTRQDSHEIFVTLQTIFETTTMKNKLIQLSTWIAAHITFVVVLVTAVASFCLLRSPG